jgi:hypothetical protein
VAGSALIRRIHQPGESEFFSNPEIFRINFGFRRHASVASRLLALVP